MTSQKGNIPLLVLLVGAGLLIFLALTSIGSFQNNFLASLYPKKNTQAAESWAFEETFDYGVPTAPSQTLLPKTFDFVATHRNKGLGQSATSNAKDEFFMSDHGDNCLAAANPSPISSANPILHHNTATNHLTDGTSPDKSFFICNNHMMSSMGDVDGYSVTAFWPKQEFDFSSGEGVLEWDVNLGEKHRAWWEVMIVGKENIQFGAARDWLPISETYPKNTLVFIWDQEARKVIVTKDKAAPEGKIIESTEWGTWSNRSANDIALTDPRIRRKMRVEFKQNQLIWSMQKPDGTFDSYPVAVEGGLPLTKGLVMFKTHAYTPSKENNDDHLTFHWDNIRFNGPKIPVYENYEISEVVELTTNGSVPIGSTKTVTLNLPKIGPNPVFVGQTRLGQPGQVLLSINGNPNVEISPHSHSSKDNPCYYDGWRTFYQPINPALLKVGQNTFKWTVGPRPACAAGQWWWDGFAVKAMEIQFDGVVANSSLVPDPSVKIGDIDGNGKVDIFDFNQMLTDFGKNGASLGADLDKNGKVDIFDYNALISNFGK